MSLINDVLLDLDRRGAEGVETPAAARHAPRRARRNGAGRRALIVAAVATVAVTVAMAAWILRPGTQPGPAPETRTSSQAVRPTPAPPATDFRPGAEVASHAPAMTEVATSKPALVAAAPPPPAPSTERILPRALEPKPPARPVRAPDRAVIGAARESDPPAPETVATATTERTVVALSPRQQAENEHRAALALMQQGRSVEAADALQRALQLEPRYGPARQALAAQLVQAGRRDEARATLEEGLALDAEQPALAMALARLEVERGDLPAAERTLRRALAAAGERDDYHAFLAAVLQRQGAHGAAAEHYRNALRRAPQNGVWWMGLAISLQADNRKAEAIDAYTRARASGVLSPELSAFVDQKLAQLR
jgi:MSHA biogenesis protein MshN